MGSIFTETDPTVVQRSSDFEKAFALILCTGPPGFFFIISIEPWCDSCIVFYLIEPWYNSCIVFYMIDSWYNKMIINDHYWPHQSLHCKGSGISLAESVLTRWCSNQRKLWGGGGGGRIKTKELYKCYYSRKFFSNIHVYGSNWPK